VAVTVPVGYDTDGAALDRDMSADARRAGARAGKSGGESFSKGFRSLIKPLAGLGAGLAVKDFLRDSIDEGREAQKVGALTTQVLKSTGKAANVSANQVGNLATTISNKIGVDDEAIQSGENLLLTFTNIRNEAGRGNKIFNQATQATTDLAAALAAASGGELNFRSSATLVGKALNDPIKGLTALSRVGVAFTDQQKEQIKTLVGQGKTLQAQKIILGQLRKEFGGAAASQATAADKAGVAVKNLEEQIGTALLPTIDDLANKVSKDVVPAVSQFITEMQDGTGRGGEFVDVLKNDVLPVAKNLGSEAKTLFKALSPILELLKDLPPQVVATGGALGVLSSGFSNLRAPLPATASGLERIGRAGANLAGAGGLLLTADAMNRTSAEAAGLEGAVGGALSGAALGAFAGPEGAIIGGGIGALAGAFTAVKSSVDASTESVERQLGRIGDLESSLKGLQALQTKGTRENIIADLNKKSSQDLLGSLGLNNKQLLNLITGGAQAQQKIFDITNAGYKQASEQLFAATQDLNAAKAKAAKDRDANGGITPADDVAAVGRQQAIVDSLNDQVKAMKALGEEQEKYLNGLRDQQEATRKARAEALTLKQIISLGVPKPVAHLIDTEGVIQDIGHVEDIISKFKIVDQTKWKAILKAEGLPATDANIKQIIRDLDNAKLARKLHLQGVGPEVLNQLKAIQTAANNLDGKKIRLTVTATTNANLAELAGLQGKARGGPVNAGQPYIVGETRREVFVPDRPGTIVPSVQQYQRDYGNNQAGPITIIQNDFGPTTSRAKVQEMQWALRYGTRAVQGREVALSG
jgi:hypothetical protein